MPSRGDIKWFYIFNNTRSDVKNAKANSPVISFNWCHDATAEDTLCKLYLDNVSADYISHSELQGERADASGNWRADLPEVIRGEIRAALSHDWTHGDSTLLAVATAGEAIVGMALVSSDTRQRASTSFAALDDLVLLPSVRGSGIGSLLVEWVADELHSHGIARLFLECGAHNLTAQTFFQGRGFKQVSVVMLRELDAAAVTTAVSAAVDDKDGDRS
jgi:GNAT superfamily N-acetyltransferase